MLTELLMDVLPVVIGVIIGGLISTVSMCYHAIFVERRAARSGLCEAFAPALTQIVLARHHGPLDPPRVSDILKSMLPTQSAAIEKLRPHIRDGIAYQKAWKDYHKAASKYEWEFNVAGWPAGEETPWDSMELKIHVILDFAKS